MAITVQWQQASQYPAASDRNVINAMAFPAGYTTTRDGVLTRFGLQPTTTTGMKVSVAAGMAMVSGYLVTVDIATSVTLEVGGAQKRTDLIVLRVYDETEGDTKSEGAIEVVKGDPGGATPNMPTRSLLLGTVSVAATQSTLAESDLTDDRQWSTGRGGILYMPGGLDEDPPGWMSAGQAIYDPGPNKIAVKGNSTTWLTYRPEGTTVPVSDGGTGRTSLTSGSYLRGNGSSAPTSQTPAQVWDDVANEGSDVVDVSHGGSGLSTLPNNQYLKGGGSSPVQYRTYAEVWNEVANKGSSTVDVPHGGTGRSTLPNNQYLKGGGSDPVQYRTYAEVWADIKSNAATVASSGNYLDLSNRPVVAYASGEKGGLNSANAYVNPSVSLMGLTVADATADGNWPANTSAMVFTVKTNSDRAFQFWVNDTDVGASEIIYFRSLTDEGVGPWKALFDARDPNVTQSRSVSTGDGLTGGGNLSANRTIKVDSSVARTSTKISAGSGLSGGGTLASDRTISIADTGWLNCSMKSGATGQVKAKMLGGVVYLSGLASVSGGPLAELPASIPGPRNTIAFSNGASVTTQKLLFSANPGSQTGYDGICWPAS